MQRGFADIPLGEASPFIVRRTTALRCSPRLASARLATPSTLSKRSHKLTEADFPGTPAEGSRGHKVLEPVSLQNPVAAATSSTDSPGKKASCVSPASSSSPSGDGRRRRLSLSARKTPEQRGRSRETLGSSSQEENCHVQ